ncbi:hypothetical protein LPYR103PRE_21520 [Segatella asaccharophila]|jgi:uncharacterized protein involved in copper resistance
MDHIDVLITGMNSSDNGEKVNGRIEYPTLKESMAHPFGPFWYAIKRYYTIPKIINSNM